MKNLGSLEATNNNNIGVRNLLFFKKLTNYIPEDL